MDKAILRRRISLAFLTAFAAVLLALPLRLFVATRDPKVTFPPPAPLPSPNAFDVYLGATKHLKNTKAVADAVASKPKKRWTLAEKKRLVGQNAAVLGAVRRGVRLPYREPMKKRGAEVMFPHYAQFREITRLTVLDGNVSWEEGRKSAAADSWLDALTFGGQIPRGGFLITRLVGIACQSLARRPLWRNLDSFDAATARSAARRMERIEAQAWPYEETLLEEKYFGQASLLQMFHDPEGFTAAAAENEEDKEDALYNRFVLPATYMRWSKRDIMNNYSRAMDTFRTEWKKPYPQRTTAKQMRVDDYSAMFLDVMDEAALKQVNSAGVQNGLLTIALALRAHKAERGAYPAALEELMPRYLAKIPSDPFALSGSFFYKQTAKGYLLYSIGPDGKDDGGKPIDNPGKSGVARRWANADSRGDVVAGVNIY